MARPRSKPFKGGDKFVVYLPLDIDEDTLKLINAPKYISPVVVELIQEKAKEVYSKNNSEDKKE